MSFLPVAKTPDSPIFCGLNMHLLIMFVCGHVNILSQVSAKTIGKEKISMSSQQLVKDREESADWSSCELLVFHLFFYSFFL